MSPTVSEQCVWMCLAIDFMLLVPLKQGRAWSVRFLPTCVPGVSNQSKRIAIIIELCMLSKSHLSNKSKPTWSLFLTRPHAIQWSIDGIKRLTDHHQTIVWRRPDGFRSTTKIASQIPFVKDYVYTFFGRMKAMSIKVKAVERNVSFDKNVEKWAYVMQA